MKLFLDAPIRTWEEAIPLGNGLMGGLLYGQGAELKMSLDRGDLWDERPTPGAEGKDFTWRHWLELKNAERWEDLEKRFDTIFTHLTPTKLPGGRLELQLENGGEVSGFSLDLEDAVARAEFSDNAWAECFFSAVDSVALLRLTGVGLRDWYLVSPTVVQEKLGYSEARCCETGEERWFVQDVPEGLAYAVVGALRRNPTETLLALTITSTTTDGKDPLETGLSRMTAALDEGYENLLAAHRQWWRRFWEVSCVRVPDQAVQEHYNLTRYFLGSASRTGAPPMPLQGVWTADDGLPPWKGDYHHDLNTEMMYLPYLVAGHLAEGRVFLDLMWSLLPVFRQFARDFYHAPGAMFPGVMSLGGRIMGGWPMFSLMPQGNASWVGWMFHRHWRYSRDETFLRERAYPFCSELGECLCALLQPGEDGIQRMPMSSSPEIFRNTPQAYLPPHSNYDRDGMEALFGGLSEMAAVLGKAEESARWAGLAAGVGERWADPQTGELGFAPGVPFDRSHRHHSHLMSIHPYGQLTVEGGASDRRQIEASLAALERNGVGEWCGYSHTWAACILARAGQAEEALKNLGIYLDAYLSRNGFHLNCHQKGGPGWGWKWGFPRLFTLEGNFLAMEAVHEMLLQSWGGVLRVFPAMPAPWTEASFRDLRAEGGFHVTAERRAGVTTRLEVLSTVGGPLHLKTPWRDISVNGVRVTPNDADRLEIPTEPGARLIFTPTSGEAV